MIKKGLPRPGELVIAEVVSINPNSVIVKLKEYEGEGLIHISEVSSGWIKDIRRFVKIGQEIVGKVLRSHDGILLSMKRVSQQEGAGKIKNYRLELRAEKLIEMAGQSLGLSPKQTHDEIGDLILDKFGSFYEVFKLGVNKPQQLKKHIPDKWIDIIIDLAKKNIAKKEFELRARLFLSSTKSDGIVHIKDVLKRAEKSGLGITYISAPEYLIKYPTKDPKKGLKELESKLEKIVSESELARFEIIDQ
ncbi:MAG: S1 RNA-binding domain-containing protein [Candidatus Aenigmarchaeota archaeon]|nr:S1 RNA-binding domain-containing protein [Candidatus Aenigmarchaeota archaeon]